MSKRLRSILVIAVTVILLFLVLRKVGLDELFETLRGANLNFLLLSIMMMPLTILVSVAKWQILLRSQGFPVSFVYLLKLYFVGYFFNNFLPSNVGGDVIRSYELGNHIKDPAKSLASVFMERMTGFVVLIALAVLAAVTNLSLLEDTLLSLATLGSIVGLIGVLWLVLDQRLAGFVAAHVRVPIVQKGLKKFNKFHSATLAYKDDKRTLVITFLLSLVFYGFAILNVYFSALTFHQPIALLDIAIIVPIIMLVSMLPLTFNGIGVQEWAYVLLFGWIGLPGSIGLSAILLIRAKTIVSALIGGILYPQIRLTNQDVSSTGLPTVNLVE